MTIANHRWPDNPFLSFQVTRLLGIVDFGGADFTEIYETCRRIDPKDAQTWHREWLRTAQAVEARGRRAEALGNWITARNAYQRACNYYRAAQFLSDPLGEEKNGLLEKLDQVFQDAMRYFEVPGERIGVPYQGQELPGYFFPALGRHDGPAPTFLYINGGDSLSSEVYFTVGRTFTEAGYNFMVFDQPGVGLTLTRKKLPTRPDAEAFVTPAVDYLLRRSDVDASRVILIGESLAGYLVPRAAAFEKRVAAAVAYSPVYEIEWRKILGLINKAMHPYLLALVGGTSFDEVFAGGPRFTYSLEGVLAKIECPLLLIQGTEEQLLEESLAQLQRIYDQAGSKSKKMVILEPSPLGGTEHCQKDNLHVAHEATLNWLCSLGIAPQRVSARATETEVRELAAATR